MRLDALPPPLRAQAERQLGIAPSFPLSAPRTPLTSSASAGGLSKPNRPVRRPHGSNLFHRPKNAPDAKQTTIPSDVPTPPALLEADYAPTDIASPPYQTYTGTPNKTEAAYNRERLHGLGRFEAITLRLPGGNYTPDWMTVDEGVITLHEVKGSFRFGSESRAILAFRSAAAAFPFFRFVWAMKAKGGKWIVKHLLNGAPKPQSPPSSAAAAVVPQSLFDLTPSSDSTAATARTTDAASQENDRAM